MYVTIKQIYELDFNSIHKIFDYSPIVNEMVIRNTEDPIELKAIMRAMRNLAIVEYKDLGILDKQDSNFIHRYPNFLNDIYNLDTSQQFQEYFDLNTRVINGERFMII